MEQSSKESSNLAISIVIPFYNEEECVVSVLEEVRRCQPDAEVIAVDDGSSDSTWELIDSMEGITGLRFPANRGQSAAMLAGLHQAKNDILVAMDGDGQNDPADITNMVSQLGSADAVFGFRAVRKDTWDRRVASKIANSIRRLFINDGVTDTGCSLKVFRKDMIHCLPPFNGLHRFMGAFFVACHYSIREVAVNHRPRTDGVSKYNNLNRALRGIYDLIGVSWYINRRVDIRVDK
ncbi:MAG: glycosyltransferase family 2 protein [Pseudomonadales bacterium]|nr:glycosyltransferase family 2 protein [Pseudomonadales bacterium]